MITLNSETNGGGNDSAMNWGADSATVVDVTDGTGLAPRPRRHWCTRLSFNLNDSDCCNKSPWLRAGSKDLRLELCAVTAPLLRVDVHR